MSKHSCSASFWADWMSVYISVGQGGNAMSYFKNNSADGGFNKQASNPDRKRSKPPNLGPDKIG